MSDASRKKDFELIVSQLCRKIELSKRTAVYFLISRRDSKPTTEMQGEGNQFKSKVTVSKRCCSSFYIKSEQFFNTV